MNVYNFYGPVSGNIYGYLDDGFSEEDGGLSLAEAGTPVLDIHPVGVGAAGSQPGAEARSGDTPVLQAVQGRLEQATGAATQHTS